MLGNLHVRLGGRLLLLNSVLARRTRSLFPRVQKYMNTDSSASVSLYN